MLRPSGAHLGEESLLAENVSWRTCALATSSSQMLRCRAAPLTGSVTVNTTRVPSGDSSSSPMPRLLQRLRRCQHGR